MSKKADDDGLLCYRLMKDGNIWDYSDFAVDVVRWSSKILAEEPDARVEIDIASTSEWEAWRIGG